MTEPVPNAFTVDVEDYFHVSAFEPWVSREDWSKQELRVEASTHRLLDLLDEFQVQGTFFVLGWVAERVPQLVAEIRSRGHELGSHSYWHRLVYDLSPEEFRDDLRRSLEAIEAAAGIRPRSYRAPSFSVTKRSLWALEILAAEGITLDSSIFPVRHDRYGIPDFPRHPVRFEEPARRGLVEVPMTTWRTLGLNLPTAGGGYFRLFPLRFIRAGTRQANRKGWPGIFYIHPWELDPDQPKIPASAMRRFRHYVGLKKTERKLRRLLESTRFTTLSEATRAYFESAEAVPDTAPERTGAAS